MFVKTWKASFSQPGEKFEILRLPLSMQSLDEASLHLPGGAYTTFRTYSGRKVLHLEDHLSRLEQTAEMAGQPVKLARLALRSALRRALHEAVLEALDIADWRIRLTLDLEAHPGNVYISLLPLVTLPDEAYQHGVPVVTCSLQRQLPKAKLTRFIVRAGAVRQNLLPGIEEAVMFDTQGRLLEGLSSNFFAVRAGVVCTAEAGVLSGVTRSLALQAAGRLNIPVQLEPVSLADLPCLDEAFITSASRGLLPVCQIDQALIGKACPGPFTHQLMHAFQAMVQEQLEPI